MNKVNRTSNIARDQRIIAGIQKHLMNDAPMKFNGVTYTPAALVALFQSQMDLAGEIENAKARWISLTKADADLAKLLTIVVYGLRELVRQSFTDESVLADFGFTARKPPRALTPAENVIAVAKRKATRAARGTMGPKKKLAIKGALAGPVVVSIEPDPKPKLEVDKGSPLPT